MGTSSHQAHDPGSRPITNADLVRHLCAASTSLREASRLHLKHFGTLIPHVFMAEVLARVGYCVSHERGNSAMHYQYEATTILDVLEQGLAEGERETRNVIALSFVNDAEIERFFSQLRPLLGPRMLAQLGGR